MDQTLMKILIGILSLLFFISTSCFGQFNTQKADSIFNHYYEKGIFMGNVLLAKDGQIHYSKSFGYSDITYKTLHTENSTFYLASLAKPITASAIFLLEQQDKLQREDKVSKYLSSFPYPKTTINQLLTHTSGLGDLLELIRTHGDTTQINSNEDVLTIYATKQPSLLSEPGTKWFYSDINFLLLALIIEKQSKERYETFLYKHFFNPVESKIIAAPTENEKTYFPKIVTGYQMHKQTKVLENAQLLSSNYYTKFISACYGDGGLYGSIIDLFKWSNAIDNPKILSNSKEMYQPAVFNSKEYVKTSWGNNVAFGWDTDLKSDLGMNGNKGGQFMGYMGVIYKFPETGYTMIVLSNIETDQFWEIGSKVFDCIED